MPGSARSTIRQAGGSGRGRARKLSADSNVSTWQRSARNRASTDSRTRESSSTTQTTGLTALALTAHLHPDRGTACIDALAPSVTPGSRLEGRSHAPQQHLVVEWFGQEVGRARSERLDAYSFVTVSGDENNGDPDLLRVEPGLQLEARHARHADVGDQAGRQVLRAGVQELLPGRESPRRQSRLSQQALQGPAHELVVVDDGPQ